MELGKWIVFAFLLGCVIVGFKSRQLKPYEFIICGAFMILADGLVFHGAISRWIGELGTNAKNAVGLPHLPGAAALSMAAPISTPWARRFAAACWKHRPGTADLIVVAVCSAVLAGVLDLSVPVTGAVFAGTLTALVGLAAATDPTVRNPKPPNNPPADRGEDAAAIGPPVPAVKPTGETKRGRRHG